MEFRSILSESELPKPGTEHENQYFDFKLTIPLTPHLYPIVVNEWKNQKWELNQEIESQHNLRAKIDFDQFEIAKDIAAFANSLGGVILYGAAGSDKNGRKIFLNKYMPVSRDIAERWHTEVNQALVQRCAPSPHVLLRILPCEGNWVLSANIWAYPRQPVGVRIKNKSRLNDGFGDDSYIFPLRVTEQTTFLTPEQLPMYIDPTIRANGIYLSRILKEQSDPEKRIIKIHGSALGEMSFFFQEAHLLDVDTLSNTYYIRIHSIYKTGLPISSINDVWKEADGRYCVTIKGRIEVRNHELLYVPH